MTRSDKETTMTHQESVQGFFRGLSAMDVSAALADCTADVRYMGVEKLDDVCRRKWYEGKEVVARYLGSFVDVVSDLDYKVVEIVDEGDVAFAEWSDTATKPDGSAYQNIGVMVFQFQDDRIREIRGYYDFNVIEGWAVLAPIQ
jgi:ketosteroid isomerase-like protein